MTVKTQTLFFSSIINNNLLFNIMGIKGFFRRKLIYPLFGEKTSKKVIEKLRSWFPTTTNFRKFTQQYPDNEIILDVSMVLGCVLFTHPMMLILITSGYSITIVFDTLVSIPCRIVFKFYDDKEDRTILCYI